MTAAEPASIPAAACADILRGRLSPESIVRLGEPLARRTTLRVGGPADLYLEPAGESDLGIILEVCAQHAIPWMILGRGSNLLVRDGGIRGAVLSLSSPMFSEIRAEGGRIHCGAGARLRAVAFEARRAALAGFEFMEGIPGSVGGALRMNAGAMGRWMFETVRSVRVMSPSGQARDLPAVEIPAEYRACPLLRTHIALGAVLEGTPGAPAEIDLKMSECSQKRWSSQPAAPSAGCIFKNPAAIPAGRLVEELGLKGTRRGGAAISEVHGNFIVNEGRATARDILELISLVQGAARAQRGIELHTEVQIVGEDE